MIEKKWLKILLKVLAVIAAVVVFIALLVLLPLQPEKNETSRLGVTFSPRAAEFLGLDWREAYKATINELKPEIIRIPVYWNILEEERNSYNWEPFDFQLDLLSGMSTEVILAIGHKLPRWPECHHPEWLSDLSQEEIDSELMQMLKDVVNRYKDHDNVYAWQVENEALFPFGDCPEWDEQQGRLAEEIKLVRSLDSENKVITSDSGELSTWLRTASLPIDALAISLYRVAYNERHDYFYWPVNPYFYKVHAFLVSPLVDDILITELQMEPWGPDVVENLSQEEVNKSFRSDEFEKRLDFAARTGATDILGWGVEWWYYMKEVRGNSEYWDLAVENFNK